MILEAASRLMLEEDFFQKYWDFKHTGRVNPGRMKYPKISTWKHPKGFEIEMRISSPMDQGTYSLKDPSGKMIAQDQDMRRFRRTLKRAMTKA